MLTVFEDVSKGRYVRTAVASSGRDNTKGRLMHHKALERIEGNLAVDGEFCSTLVISFEIRDSLIELTIV